MPKFNMFGFKGEPSADALAGVGPTTTYPVSPSSGISPEAIASTAAGTVAPSGTKPQTSNIAAASPNFNSAASASSPAAPATNPAAAAANGFYGASGANAPTAATPASYGSATGTSGGFTYGQNPNAGKTSTGIAAIPAGYAPNKPAITPSGLPAYAQTTPATATPAATTPAYTAVPGYPLTGSTAPPATTASVDPVSAAPSQFASVPPANVAPSSPPPTSPPPAFAMPPLAGTTSAASPPSASVPTTGGGFTMPTGVVAPTTNVASLPSSPRATAPTAPSTGGYKPGSTAGAVSYPAGDYPSTGQSDTFYR